MAKTKPIRIDLTDQRFGDWEVIQRSGSQNGKSLWLCRCKCGNESHVTTGNLRSGISAHCRSCASRNYQAVAQEDLANRRFGSWTVLKRAGSTSAGKAVWLCRCECGTESIVPTGDLKAGKSLICRSCSTTQFQTKHGHTIDGKVTRTFNSWANMLVRCGIVGHKRNANTRRYADRGIIVCERWLVFSNFLADMGECPGEGHSLDRYPDNDGNYSPSNCRWATRREQMRNMSKNRHLVYRGETMCLAEAADRFGIPYKALHWRLDSGWSVQAAIETPMRATSLAG